MNYEQIIKCDAYKQLYSEAKLMRRNKFMSDYKSKNISLDDILENWYLDNKINITNKVQANKKK